MQELQVLEGHTDRVWAVAWSPSGENLASCSGDKTVRLWRERRAPHPNLTELNLNGSETRSEWFCAAVLEDGHSRAIRSLSWAPSGRQLAVASFDATTTIWEEQGRVWEQVASLEGHENEVKCVAWSPAGDLVATCGRDKSVWLWESLPGHEFECVDVKQGHKQAPRWRCCCTLAGCHERPVFTVDWSPMGGNMVATGDGDNAVMVFVPQVAASSEGQAEFATAWQLHAARTDAHAADVNCVRWHPNRAGLLASCSDDGSIKLWRVQGP
ncbi:probable cytosolic iron-sulfur protein assembly protein CIAO1 homolog [Haematococcus lacustris]|uniref:Probable cytosolic iron-sulfur protein assembly protein CIAO1 homolog n=1 Tax=Haematococcus lacustris TaxID=44745 RepID=A0A699ZUP8_HAELA|nr:probable cytosolic iron-sulfur protein assembly protein CIAO1 homolog [Haematococcus lacustris]